VADRTKPLNKILVLTFDAPRGFAIRHASRGGNANWRPYLWKAAYVFYPEGSIEAESWVTEQARPNVASKVLVTPKTNGFIPGRVSHRIGAWQVSPFALTTTMS
jgi:hypothetical protein